MECLGDELVFVFLRGTLPDTQRDGVREHIGTCSACRRLVSEVARSLDDGTQATAQPTEQSAPLQLAPDQLIGRYILGARLGVGTSGVVHRAHDPHLGRDVALKILQSADDGASTSTSSTPSRLMREAKAMARLSDPNVVTVYDAGAWQGSVFIAMELVDGRTLREWLREAPRSEPVILAVLVAAGRGLAAAHAVDLVHRDFKPANVLVGKDGRVRVTDFGLAQPAFVDEVAASTSDGADPPWAAITQTGSLGGTPAYMAPEVFGGSVGDARSDQYSYCVALFEAIHGRKPIERETVQEMVGAAVMSDIEWPPSGSMSPHVERVLRRGLQRDPEQRYPSMNALLDELQVQLVPAQGAPRWRVLAVAAAAAFAAVLVVAALAWPKASATMPLRTAFSAWAGRVAVSAPAGISPDALPEAHPQAGVSAAATASALPAHAAGAGGRRPGGAAPSARPAAGASAAPSDPDALLPDPWDGKR